MIWCIVCVDHSLPSIHIEQGILAPPLYIIIIIIMIYENYTRLQSSNTYFFDYDDASFNDSTLYRVRVDNINRRDR